MTLGKKVAAEFIGTAWLVLGGCGSAVISAGYPLVGIGLLGIAIAFGLSLLIMAFAVGPISGAHLNPAVSLGQFVAGRMPRQELFPYIFAQFMGAILGAFVLYLIASGRPGFSASGGFAANGYGTHSPGGYGLASAFLAELVLTFVFVFAVLGATDKRTPAGLAPVGVGLALTAVHLVGIPVTNLSVNPARSTGPALFAGTWAIGQLWLFWLVPALGGAVAGILYPMLTSDERPSAVWRGFKGRFRPEHPREAHP